MDIDGLLDYCVGVAIFSVSDLPDVKGVDLWGGLAFKYTVNAYTLS